MARKVPAADNALTGTLGAPLLEPWREAITL